jgi:hypothetical protein
MPLGAVGDHMKFFALVFLFLLATTGTVLAQASVSIERIEFKEHGIYTVDRKIEGRDGVGINKAAALNLRHAATLRTIPAQMGTTFGFEYNLVGTPNDGTVELREIVIFPRGGVVPPGLSTPITRDEFTLEARIGETGYAGYTFEDSFELVTGTWTFEIWYGDRKLGSQSFKVVALNSECEMECDSF